jgi:hypothetical protein
VPWPKNAPAFIVEGFAAERLPDPDWTMYTEWFEVEFQAELQYESRIVAAYQRDRRSDLLGTAAHGDSWSETLHALHENMKHLEERRGILAGL